MLYVFWALLNIGLLIYFLYLFAKVAGILASKIGRFPGYFFALALLSFVCRPYSNKFNSGTNEIKKWGFAVQDSLEQNSLFYKIVPFKTTPISKYNIGFKYGTVKYSKKVVPLNAYSNVTGLIIGIDWIPNNIIMEPIGDGQKFHYIINATTQWRLLGFPVYTQCQDYTGTVSVY